MDLGAPISYLVLTEDTPVYARDGTTELGSVKRVLAVPEEDVFDGLLIHTPDGERFVDADGVRDIHEHGVVLDFADGHDLHEPTASPAVMEAGPDDAIGSPVRDRLRRAWNLISGNY
jgi:hypothetical protein